MDERKNLFILITVLFILILTWVVLNFQRGKRDFQKAQIYQNQEKQVDEIEKIAYTKEKSIIRLSKSEILNYRLLNDGNILFYEKANSSVYKTDPRGKDLKIIANVPNVSEIIFSSDGNSLIVTDNERGDKFFFDLVNNKKVELNKNIKSVAFSPDGKKIAYHFYDPQTKMGNISISKPDGSDFINIFKTRVPELTIMWPKEDLIMFYRSDLKNITDLFVINPDGKDFRKIFESGAIEQINSSSVNNRFLLSTKGGKENISSLFLINGDDYSINTGFNFKAKQCDLSFDNSNLICAKGEKIFKIELDKNGFPQNAFSETENKNIIFSDPNFEPINLKFSSPNYLIFINNKNKNLYSLKMTK